MWYAASRVTSVRQGRRPVNPCPIRARSLAMPSSVMRAPCPATSAMRPPSWCCSTGRARSWTQQPVDGLLEKPPLHIERPGFGGILPERPLHPPQAAAVDEVREHQAEEAERQMRHLVARP